MDKQFARILMLSVLLPAGAALGQALQREHVTFAAMDDDSVISNVAESPPAKGVDDAATGRAHRTVTALRNDRPSRTVAYGAKSGSYQVR